MPRLLSRKWAPESSPNRHRLFWFSFAQQCILGSLLLIRSKTSFSFFSSKRGILDAVANFAVVLWPERNWHCLKLNCYLICSKALENLEEGAVRDVFLVRFYLFLHFEKLLTSRPRHFLVILVSGGSDSTSEHFRHVQNCVLRNIFFFFFTVN